VLLHHACQKSLTLFGFNQDRDFGREDAIKKNRRENSQCSSRQKVPSVYFRNSGPRVAFLLEEACIPPMFEVSDY
jgi:hypothetical protein